LNIGAWEVAHFLIHDALASLTDPDPETHYCVPVNAGHPFNGAGAGTFSERGDDRDLFVGAKYVCHENNRITIIWCGQQLFS